MRQLITAAVAAALLGGGLVGGSLVAGTAVAADGGSRAAKTHVVVVRPVNTAGKAQPGWSVRRMRGVRAECDGSAAAAVDDGIYACYPSAAYLPACWPSRHHTVLCLRDAREQKLVRVRYRGKLGSATAPQRPSPQDLDLARGQTCDLRVGGAWGTLPTHPNWVGFYSCTHGSVYGPPHGDGVDRAAQPWTVRVWKSGTAHRVVRRAVATAYVVGTHG
jgi:hypothetical protein